MPSPQLRWLTYTVDVHPQSPLAHVAGVRSVAAPAAAPVTVCIDLPDLSGYPTPADKAEALLAIAAEVEHALLVQYLYAAYSLKTPNDIGSDADKKKAVSLWRRTIVEIAKEEMGHLMTVQNLHLVLGLRPTFERDEFPMLADLFPFDFHLGPLTQKTLAEYVVAESPTNSSTYTKLPEIMRLADCQAGMPVNHVGNLYGLLGVVFAESRQDIDQDAAGGDMWYGMVKEIAAAAYQQDPSPLAWHLDGSQFDAATVPQQAQPGDFGVSPGGSQPPKPGIRLWQCANRADAKAAIRDIGLQGEGLGSPPGEKSHFQRFYEIYTGEDGVLAFPAEGEWVPTYPVPMDPVISDEDKPNAISEPKAQDYAALADLRYVLVLGLLGQYLVADPARRKALNLSDWAVNEMLGLKALSTTLVVLPRSPARPAGGTAALPFTLPDVLVPPDETGGWRLLIDRLQKVIHQEDHIYQAYNDNTMKQASEDHNKQLAMLKQQLPGG